MTGPSKEFLDLQEALAGEYSLQRELGRGGMGIVYLARDVQLDRDVAIKVLPALLAQKPQMRDRFLREARTAAGLSHPHIVPIHRVSEVKGFVLFVMSYVEGETLGERLRTKGPLPPADTSRIMREVAWALAYAHGRGIVHRDVKPDNILLEASTGRALVTDFGIAHRDVDDSDPGKVMGTVNFISPEQVRGERIDGRSDIYAIGVVGYLAVSGRLPFESKNVPALILKQATENAPTVLNAAPGLPPALGAAIDRCLQRDPGDRFTDGEALAAALAPASDARPALPVQLRAWLAARNPMTVPFAIWSAGFGLLTAGNTFANLTHNPGSHWRDVLMLAGFASAPIVPFVGYYLYQARRQFRAGYTLSDLRVALEVDRKERAETDAAARVEIEPSGHRLLRLATVASGTWLGATIGLTMLGVINERINSIWWFITPAFSTLLLGAASNALDIQFIPDKLRKWWRTGIGHRIWNSRIGDWIAKQLKAPERSKLAGPSAFHATEVALGLAAAELFAALPKDFQEQIGELPLIVESLEARAAEARAEMDVVKGMAASGTKEAAVLELRRKKASAQLAESVAALEGIRLDLLRLHAGAEDLAPLTTLMDAVKIIGVEIGRLADAQKEVEDSVIRNAGAKRTPTPA